MRDGSWRRSSGTEPKLKIYVDLRPDLGLGLGADVFAAEAALRDETATTGTELPGALGFG